MCELCEQYYEQCDKELLTAFDSAKDDLLAGTKKVFDAHIKDIFVIPDGEEPNEGHHMLFTFIMAHYFVGYMRPPSEEMAAHNQVAMNLFFQGMSAAWVQKGIH